MTTEDQHEWVSFADPDEDRTWIFDVTFLMSNWNCIFGQGCKGVLTEDATERNEGCCSYGAHLVDEADRDKVEAAAKLLHEDEWQFASVAARRGGVTKSLPNGDLMTRLVDDACIFLNREGFATGPGCALHFASERMGRSYLELKPEVCWQVPVRREDSVGDSGHVTSTLREWKRRDWGEGGDEFHWWCTDSPEAFTGKNPVYETLKDELIAMTSVAAYRMFVAYVEARESESTHSVFLPHPAVRRRT